MLRRLYQAAKSLDGYAQLLVYYYSQEKELKEILRNNPQPELTAEEKREIDSYWGQYGIKFTNYRWFQWYYGFTGIKSPRFIPKQIHVKTILPYHNERGGSQFSRAFSDKNMFYDIMPGLTFPELILKNVDGVFFDKDGRYICSNDSLLDLLAEEQGDCIVKSSIDSGLGKSVKKYPIMDKQDAQRLLLDWNNESNFIVQKAIKQHPFFSRFNESSVNVLRINSLCINGHVEIHTPILRFGYPGWITDVTFIDGLEDVRVVGIKEDGCLMDEVVSLQGKRWKLSEIVQDPQNKRIPCWDEIVSLIKENAPKLTHIGRVGWDFAVSEDEKPVAIEYNLSYPGSILSQMAAGPLFGEHTDEALEFLKDEENQRKYVPRWLRA
ncbi:MAG: hypothetical protein HDQ87_04995 [Clostridia bacterium]|nr:hypothetical protein [Clostridia bacterium]